MNHIKSLHIEGFKKFKKLDVEFNDHMNILVGGNESGKSTILDAIRIVLNQQYRNSDKSVLRDLFNVDMVESFRENPSVKSLPRITLELELELTKNNKTIGFFGEAYGSMKSQGEKSGIRFECGYDEIMGEGMEESIHDGIIPYEYYSFLWTTFANIPYHLVNKPIKNISIDTTANATTSTFNSYSRSLFNNKYEEYVKSKARNDFRTSLDTAFNDIDLPELGENRRFGIDMKKVILDTVLSVYEGSIALENHGSGMESLIKTEIALDRSNGLDTILMEEPENHLSFITLRKMVQDISDKKENSQIIITTHNSMIASRLNLNNILWIADGHVKSLSEVDKDVANFFIKADDNSLLQLLLSDRIILVEGATEFLLIPHLYEQKYGTTVEKDSITVISCGGISYRKYLEIAEKTNKKVVVITDNDGCEDRIEYAKNYNENHSMQHIYMGYTTDHWTWEVCMYECNKEVLDKIIKTKQGSAYKYKDKSYDPVLGKMLNNKVDSAYNMMEMKMELELPDYVKEALEWLRN